MVGFKICFLDSLGASILFDGLAGKLMDRPGGTLEIASSASIYTELYLRRYLQKRNGSSLKCNMALKSNMAQGANFPCLIQDE